MRRTWLLASAACALLIVVGLAWHTSSTGAQDQDNQNGNGKKANLLSGGPLPIRQVVLFNSGVGYFQREGEVDGNAHVELAFPSADINDLLKSLILQDLGGGKISTVSYDSHDPIDKILRSFALDLNGNPTFGQILNQARGERVELLLKSEKKDSPPIKIQGVIVGMELKRRPIGKDAAQVVDIDTLNISGTSGLQGVHLEDVLGVRFLNATLENEFQRALRVLASSHDTQKKTVSLGFSGAGKRAVRVGYVVDRPIWKTSYRLRVEPGGKIFLQGWAMVENTSDDDWNNVRMVLVSGRPISFEMNLYEPLYMPRPFVEPELYASLRPPVYSGAMSPEEGRQARAGGQPFNAGAAAGNLANPLGGGIGGAGAAPPVPVSQGGPADIRGGLSSGYGGGGGFGGGGFGGQGFGGGNISGSFQGGFNGGGSFQSGQFTNPYQFNPRGDFIAQNRLTYEELQRRRQVEAQAKDEAKNKGPAITGLNFKEGIASVASAEEVGDYFQYIIDQKITLSRQKSALLPILDQTIAGAKVSIFNEETHAKHPLLGLRLKNTSGQPLTQGPITVYDNSTYAGDTRILDLQPGEERLLSYAMDLGTEIKTDVKATLSPEMHLRLGEPSLTARYKMRETRTYTIKNRSTHDRAVILEHPIRSDWQLVDTKPSEKTRSHYRFNVNVASGKSATFDVIEEQPRVDLVAITNKVVPIYTLAQGLHVKEMIHLHPHRLTNLKIQKGLLVPTFQARESRSYHIQNLSDVDRVFTIDHVIRKDWSRIDPKGDPQHGPGVFRFKLDVGKGKTASQEIVEERVYSDEVKQIAPGSEARLREFLAHPVPSADVKVSLAKVLGLQAKWSEIDKQLSELEKSLKVISDDQSRLRENLRIIPQTSDPYKRFLDKFVAQETEIESLQKSVRQTQTSLQAAQRDYFAFIAGLTAE